MEFDIDALQTLREDETETGLYPCSSEFSTCSWTD